VNALEFAHAGYVTSLDVVQDCRRRYYRALLDAVDSGQSLAEVAATLGISKSGAQAAVTRARAFFAPRP
jgi:hypothetical protein